MEGLLPMVESAAAMSKVRLRATERMEAFSGSSWNQRTVRQTRKAKTKPINAGRSRKPPRSVAGVASVCCWRMVVIWMQLFWPLALRRCEFIACSSCIEERRFDTSNFYNRETTTRQLMAVAKLKRDENGFTGNLSRADGAGVT